ncbi:hypothetical protein [Nocardia noduli]|uniref:hypothetical protein n=1 Tax=Nocardia noduli TaxID=2815722 RepID=UPI001C24D49F|nr:hypothetical protein [Nocardia noduli]
MTDIQEWEGQLEQELAEIRRSGDRLADAVAAVRGRGEGRGVLVEVDAGGDITDTADKQPSGVCRLEHVPLV